MSPSQEDLFRQIKADFLQAVREGESPNRVELRDEYPELVPQLNELFAEVDRFPSHDQPETATLPLDNAGVDEYTTLPPEARDQEFATIVPADESNALPMTAGSRTGTKIRYFGDYELLSEIARGGMGVVYKARQVNLNRIVALKMILSGQLASDEDIRRFHTEAESAAHLDHSGIVPIYEIGEHDGQHYFSMGFVEGKSLADRVKDGPLPPQEAASLTRKISEAIAYAHEKGVIHRDLKPANVLLDAGGEPKVTDFGLARKLEQDSGLTRTGAVMGTPSYMPPEQAAGETAQVGPLADVYSLGAILYCLLTGRPPFQAANPLDTLLQVMEREPIAPTELAPTIPKDLETICLKCLQKDRLKRYESANDLAADIGRWERGEPIRARAVTRMERVYRWVKRNRIVSALLAATAVGLVLATGFGIQARKEAANARAAEGQARDAEQQSKQSETAAVASNQKTEATLAQSNYLLSLARWDKNRRGEAIELLDRVPLKHRHLEWHLARRQFDDSDLTCFGHISSVKSVSFSPDGTRIASGSYDNTIKIWNALTGTELTTLKGYYGSSIVTFSPDGTQIASGGFYGNSIMLCDAALGTALTMLRGHNGPVSSIRFSPDGTRIVSGSDDQTVKLWNAATGAEIVTLKGHTEGVLSVIFSPDGARIASGGGHPTGGEIKIWDASTGTELTTLKGHESRVSSVSFSPDGARIASGSYETINIWDAATGAELTTLTGHTDNVTSVSFSPDGTRIASGSDDQTVKIWDALTGTEITTLTGHTDSVTSLSFSPDGTRIASGSDDQTVRMWNAATGAKLSVLTEHTGRLSPDGTRIASTSWDNTIKLFDASTGTEITTLTGHTDSVSSVSFSPDGTRIASGDETGTIKIWDASTGTTLTTLKGYNERVNIVSLSPDGTRIVSGSDDQTVKIWDALTGTEITTLTGHTDSVTSLSFSPDGTRIASGSDDQTIKLWDAVTGKELTTLEGQNSVTSVIFSPDGARIASGSYETINIWDAATGTEITTLTGITLSRLSDVTSVIFSPDGKRIATVSDDQTVKLWNAATGAEIVTLKGHTEGVLSVIFSPDGTRIASGSWDDTIKLWDAVTGAEITTLTGHTSRVTSARFSPDGTRIASKSDDNMIKLWDAVTSAELTALKGHTSSVTSLSFSPDGTRIATGSIDTTIKLWDAATGTEITTFKGQNSVTSVIFSPDGARIASGSYETINIWDASTGKEISTLTGHTDAVTSVSFSPDGTRLLSEAGDGEKLFWDVRTGNVIASADVREFLGSGISNKSPNGRWLTVPQGNNVLLVDLAFKTTPNERLRRDSSARPKPRWHREQSLAAQSAKQWFAWTFHAARLLKINSADAWAYDDLHEAHRNLLATNNGQAPPVPSVVSEMLKLPRGSELPQLTEESATRLNYEIWELVKSPVMDEPGSVSAWHVQRMQDVCSHFPSGDFFSTLGVTQYQLAQYQRAIEALRKSLETTTNETDPSGPDPAALAFLALCHHQLGQTDPATQFRQQLNKIVHQEKWVLDPELQTILVEVQSAFDGPDSVKPLASLEDFNREGTFEDLAQHRWRLSFPESGSYIFNVTSENAHSGSTCLQVQGTDRVPMAHQTVEVLPHSKYRVTGWIRTELEVPEAAEPDTLAEPSNSEPPATPAVDAAAAQPVDASAPGVAAPPVAGASFGILDRDVTSEVVTGTTAWKQITWEFTTGESTTITLGCRLGLPDQPCTGTAWFDDLHLEKVE